MLTFNRLLVSFVVMFSLLLNGCGGGDVGNSVEEQASTPRNIAPGAGLTGNWVGRVDGTDAFIALVADGTQVIAYICDNGYTAEWFNGIASGPDITLNSKDGAVLQVKLNENAQGSVTLADESVHDFTAQATETSALFRADTSVGGSDDGTELTTLLAGWIALGDEVRGSIKIISSSGVTLQAAPAMSPAVSVTVAGSPLASFFPTPMTPATLSQATANDTKFIWGAMGDSYASGEGNPQTGISNPNDINNFSGLAWGSDRSMFVPMDTGSYTGDLFTCHRSDEAGAPKAQRKLQALYSGIEFKLGFVACSGATTSNLRMGGYTGPGGIDQASMRGHSPVEQISQIGRLGKFKVNNSSQLDAVYLSAGGNDIGFGDIITDCVDPFGIDIFGGCAAKWRGILPDNLGTLKESYKVLDDSIKSSLGQNLPVLISQYPNPLDRNATPCVGDDYIAHGETGIGALDDFLKNNVSSEEALFAAGIPAKINGIINSTASGQESLGWTVVHAPSFTQHGVCTETPFANLNSAAVHKQGNDHHIATFNISNGLFHPNDRGYAAYAEEITTSLRPLVDRKIRTGLAAPSAMTIGPVSRGIINVQWKDRATSENAYEIEIRAARPEDERLLEYPESATILASGDGYIERLRGTFQDFYHQPTGAGIFHYRVRACHTAISSGTQCGLFSAAITGANFKPSVPSGLTASNLINTRRTFSWNAQAEALEYVVRIPATASGKEYRTGARTLSLLLKGTQDNSVQVAACNRVACSAYSAAVSLPATAL